MYTPNNVSVYLKAFSGFLSGITAAAITDTAPGDFTAYAQQADAYAQQFDTSWGVGAVTTLELSIIEEASEAVWENRSQLVANPLIPGSYTQTVESVIARVVQGNAQVVSEGIDPNGGGAPGTGTVTSVSATAPIRITGSPAVAPNVTFQPGWTPELFLANLTSLTSFNVTAPTPLFQGAQAGVQTNGSVWSYRSAATLTDDGITVVSATGGGQWVRENVSLYLPIYLLQTAWFVDAQNVSGTASDENDGLTSATALRTKAEIYRRWGYTWAPTPNGIDVVITYLSSDTTPGDPGLFAPTLVNGATLLHTAALPATSFTGTLLSVVAKDRATNNPLESTFTTVTGAVAANMLLVNVTRGNSVGIAKQNIGAGQWVIDQPYAAVTTPLNPPGTLVDTWANGDTIHGFVPLGVDLARLGGQVTEFAAGLSHGVFQLTIIDPANDADPLQIDTACYPVLVNTVVARSAIMRGSDFFQGTSQGVAWSSPVSLATLGNLPTVGQFQGFIVQGGHFGQCVLQGISFGGDVILGDPNSAVQDCLLGDVCVQAGGTMTCSGIVKSNGSITYGGGTLDVRGKYYYTAPAATNLPMTNLKIEGDANAYSAKTTAGVTAFGPLGLSATNLDTPAGVGTGFGGLAFSLAGSCITVLGAMP